MQRVFGKWFGFSECMVILSIVLAVVVLVLLSLKQIELRGAVGDVMGGMILFYALTGTVGGIVLSATNKKGMWLLVSALSICLLVFGFLALLSNAKHWGNF